MATGLLRVVSAQELRQAEQQAMVVAQKAFVDAQDPIVVDRLAHFIRTEYSRFRRHRTERQIDRRIMDSLRTYRGEYDAAKLQAIQAFGGSEVYSRISAVKCRGATALLKDIYLSTQAWEVAPTSEPSVPQDLVESINQLVDAEVHGALMQGYTPPPHEIERRTRDLLTSVENALASTAKEDAERTEKRLKDILEEGGFESALSEFLTDLTIFPVAILKGPIVEMTNRLQWREGKMGLTREPVMKFARRDPYYVYFSPGASDIEEADVMEVIPTTRHSLAKLIGVEGYSENVIREVLDEYGRGGLRDWLDDRDQDHAELTDTENYNRNESKLIDVLQYSGHIQGRMLREWGMSEKKVKDEDLDYACKVWVVGRHVIKVVLNPNPARKHEYYTGNFERIPGSIYGVSLIETLQDVQDVANASFRALVNNMCLTGDTVVMRHAQPRKYADVTIKELFDSKQQHNSGLRRTKLRSLNEKTGEFFGNRVVDIVDNGVADVFEVKTERGYAIKATGNHRFMRDDGDWQTVDAFDVGDQIAVNGSVSPLPRVCVECGGSKKSAKGLRCRACASSARNSAWNAKQVAAARFNREASETSARARKECRDAMFSFCQRCGSEDALEVHHVDADPYNNALSNLETLCSVCHHEHHKRERALGDPYLQRWVDYDRIVSIEYVGCEQVYDLCMTAPHHNFVANGFVSHNSIASGPQVTVNTERLDDSADADNLYPWKRWRVTSDPFGGGGYVEKPVDFFQPNSNAGELLSVYQNMTMIADEISAIPRYITGSDKVGGAGETASGLAMLMNNASKVMQSVAMGVDTRVMAPLLTTLYHYVMLTDKTGLFRGDEQIVVKGVAVAMAKETDRMRKLEFLQLTTNPVDMQITGIEGRAEMLRDIGHEVGFSSDPIPTALQIRDQKRQQEEAAKLQQLTGGQAGSQGVSNNSPTPGAAPPPRTAIADNTGGM